MIGLLEVKDALYEAISEYQEKRIFSDITQGESPETISAIFNQCVSNLESCKDNKVETREAVAEALTHYLLTVALIPSQRKTSFNSVDIDVAVPDAKTLSTSPQDVVIIHFPKTAEVQAIKEDVDKIKKIQSKPENIWLVVDSPIATDAKVYTLDNQQFSFANIINDLISFSSGKKQSKFKIFKV